MYFYSFFFLYFYLLIVVKLMIIIIAKNSYLAVSDMDYVMFMMVSILQMQISIETDARIFKSMFQ